MAGIVAQRFYICQVLYQAKLLLFSNTAHFADNPCSLFSFDLNPQYGQNAGMRASAWLMIPFFLLLIAIAAGPMLKRHWWERCYPLVSLGLGVFVFIYYSLCIDFQRMAHTMQEYISFIVLIGSLFVAAGGIFLHAERRATPLVNTVLLAAGAVVSNILGTTGASMLLIRPYVRINRPRIRNFHIAFYIFVVSNIGGSLTPIGDPPLLLGYLNGVPFLWTVRHMALPWLTALSLVLAVFYFLDLRSYRNWMSTHHHPVHEATFQLKGKRNMLFLAIILAAVFGEPPSREIIMIVTAFSAYLFAQKEALRENAFTFAPIREVAVLFAGIFATMVPVLDWLALNSGRLGLRTPGEFFWITGGLSSVLDNAPTYLSFLSAALGLHNLTLGNPQHVAIFLRDHSRFLEAISLGSVFFGACTYIGNGPNFMVKSIAQHAGIQSPSFAGYVVRYSLPVLIPIYVIIWLLFLH